MNLWRISGTVGLAGVIAAGMVAGACAAEVSLLNSIPAERQTAISIDVQKVLQAPAIKALEADGGLAALDAKLDVFETATGFNLRRDLSRLVVGKFNGRDREDIVLLQGRFNQTNLLNVLAQSPQYKETTYHGTSIHSWFDENEQRQKFGAFLADDLLVISTEDGVKKVLDTRAKPGSAFGALPSVTHALSGFAREPALWAVSRDLTSAANGQNPNPVLSKVPAVVLTVDLEPGFALILSAEAADPATAIILRDFAAGLVALGKLASNKPEAQLLSENAVVRQESNNVAIAVSLPDDKFTAWLLQVTRARRATN